MYEKRVESLFKYEKGIAQFFSFPSFFRLYIFLCDVGRVYEVGECTHPYKRKIEASVERGWCMVLAEEGDIYQKAERTTV